MRHCSGDNLRQVYGAKVSFFLSWCPILCIWAKTIFYITASQIHERYTIINMLGCWIIVFPKCTFTIREIPTIIKFIWNLQGFFFSFRCSCFVRSLHFIWSSTPYVPKRCMTERSLTPYDRSEVVTWYHKSANLLHYIKINILLCAILATDPNPTPSPNP